MQDLGPSVMMLSSPVAFSYTCVLAHHQWGRLAHFCLWLLAFVEMVLFLIFLAITWLGMYESMK